MPIQPDNISKEMIVDSLYSETCPACGGKKQSEKTLCFPCFGKLPARLKADLYKPVGRGYEQAFTASLTALHADKIHFDRKW